LAVRDLGGSPRALAAASAALEARGDRTNALQARLMAARRLLLLGRLDDAVHALARLSSVRKLPDARSLTPNPSPEGEGSEQREMECKPFPEGMRARGLSSALGGGGRVA